MTASVLLFVNRCRQNIESTMDHSEFSRKIRQFCSAYLSNRKLLGITLFVLAVVVYFWPYSWNSTKSFDSDPSFYCLGDELRRWSKEEAAFDANIVHWPTRRDWQKGYVGFAGNGRFGVAVGDRIEELRVKGGRALSLAFGVHPLIQFRLKGHQSSDAIVTNYRRGTVTHIHSYSVDGECVSIHVETFAHRKYAKILMQEIKIHNPHHRSLEMETSRRNHKFEEKRNEKIGDMEYEVGGLKVKVENTVVAVSVALPQLAQQTLSIKPQGLTEYTFMTGIDSSEPGGVDFYQNQRKILEEGVIKALKTVSSMPRTQVEKSHVDVWSQLWSYEFGLSYSRAPEVLNPDLINATRYAVLSNMPAFIHEDGSPSQQVKLWEATLKKPDQMCFNAHNTLLYPSRLWSSLETVSEVVDVAFRWSLTLEKRGCHQMVDAGADGIAMAMILSFGALKFTQHHLEFDAHPSELHRDYYFGNIWYGNSSRVSIWVEVDDMNKAVLFTSHKHVGQTQRPFFACDAACLDPPVDLKDGRTQFPVKLTNPFTPILYITPERSNLEELKHSIHVKEVAIAPAHEHHVIALHKHGHRLGGLPVMFWVCLGLLIVAFHAFLVKIIYNEYCVDPDKKHVSPFNPWFLVSFLM